MSEVTNQEVKEEKKAPDIGGLFKDTGILLVITLIAGLLLGLVYQITKEPIAEQKEKAKQDACKQVFADAASFAELEVLAPDRQEWEQAGFAEETIDEVMEAQDASGAVLGYVITVTTKEGYGGDIRFTVGITETAVLGMRAEEVLAPQFAGKNVEQFEYSKSGAASDYQIDAISGATITTNAVTNGVNAGLYYFQTKLQGA